MNTTLGTGDAPLGEGFLAWRAFSNSKPDMDIAALIKRAVPSLSDGEAAAYAAPYPDARYKAGVRRFPNLVPDRPDAEGAALSRRARDFWSKDWAGESFMAIGMKDPVLGRRRCGRCAQPSETARRHSNLPKPAISLRRLASMSSSKRWRAFLVDCRCEVILFRAIAGTDSRRTC